MNYFWFLIRLFLFLHFCPFQKDVPPVTSTNTVNEKDYILFTPVETYPVFSGCEHLPKNEQLSCSNKKLMEFIYTNIEYPASFSENCISGTAVVRFTITKTGNIKDIHMLKSLHPDVDIEVINLVKKMPKWIPKKENGVLLDCYFNLPVKFKSE